MIGRPILFSAPMVRAILSGTKTQTRRVIKPQPYWTTRGSNAFTHWPPNGRGERTELLPPDGRGFKTEKTPGDLLWVRETWQCYGIKDREVFYRADGDGAGPWRPSIYMPRWASRITLELTEVRVQRVQEISEEDAKAEGAEIEHPNGIPSKSYRNSFWDLWDSINAKRGFDWAANPLVWALTFRRIKP